MMSLVDLSILCIINNLDRYLNIPKGVIDRFLPINKKLVSGYEVLDDQKFLSLAGTPYYYSCADDNGT